MKAYLGKAECSQGQIRIPMVPGSLAEAGCHLDSQGVGQVHAGTAGLGAGEFAGWV